MDFKGLFINVMIVGIVIFAIFSWIIISQQDNNTSQLITNNTIINSTYGDLYSNLNTAQSSGDQASQKFGDVPPTQNYGIVDVNSVVSPTKLFRSLLLGTYNTLITLPILILGVPPVVAGVIDAIVLLIVILGIWAIWRGTAT